MVQWEAGNKSHHKDKTGDWEKCPFQCHVRKLMIKLIILINMFYKSIKRKTDGPSRPEDEPSMYPVSQKDDCSAIRWKSAAVLQPAAISRPAISASSSSECGSPGSLERIVREDGFLSSYVYSWYRQRRVKDQCLRPMEKWQTPSPGQAQRNGKAFAGLSMSATVRLQL